MGWMLSTAELEHLISHPQAGRAASPPSPPWQKGPKEPHAEPWLTLLTEEAWNEPWH